VNSDRRELKGSDRETLDCEGDHCNPQTMAAAPGQSSAVEAINESDGEKVMSLSATIDKKLVRVLDVTSCGGCTRQFCRPHTPIDEESGVESAAHSSHEVISPGPGKVIIDSGATRHMLPWKRLCLMFGNLH